MKPVYVLLLTAVTAFTASPIFADTDCDCSRLLDQCGANISAAGTDILIRTNTKRCAQVTWYADDVAQKAVVHDGTRLHPSEFKSKPFLSVGSCNICANTHPEQAANSISSSESAECQKRKTNLKLSEKFYAQGRITPYEYQLSKDLVKKHCR